MPVCGDFQRSRQHSATTAYRALPVREWPAPGMQWGTARSNAASAVCSSFEASGTGGGGRAVQVIFGGCCFAAEWRFRRGAGSTRQPQCTEACQCVGGQPWAYRDALQGQMQPLQCAAVLKRPALGAAAGPSRWFSGVAVLQLSGDFVEEEAALGNHSAQSPASV